MESTKRYTEWLISQLMANDGYSQLCNVLQGIPFLPYSDMDLNRGDDGMNLRDEWVDTVYGDSLEGNRIREELDSQLGGGYCTMLELLLVLVRRICYETLDSQYEASMRKWFCELIDNCGLTECTDEEFAIDPEGAKETVSNEAAVIIFRRYSFDGDCGGLFPMSYLKQDVRGMDLLTQMNYYIEENYDIY